MSYGTVRRAREASDGRDMANQFLEWLWRVLAAVCVLLERERGRRRYLLLRGQGRKRAVAFASADRSTWLVNGAEWAAVQSTMIFVVFCEQILVCVITRVSRKVNLREGTSLSINYLVCNTIHIK